jgi:hypothetical protein
MDQTQKIYFAGVHDTSNIKYILKKNSAVGYRINSVNSLEIIDSQVGAMMEDVFTLVTREKVIRLTRKRDMFEAFESLQ